MISSSSPFAKIRLGLSATASVATAVGLLLGSTMTAAPAMADDTASPASGVPAIFSDRSAGTATDRFIVKFTGTAKGNPGERGKAYGKIAKQLGVSVKEVKATADGAQVISANRMLSATEVKDFVASMKTQPNVAYAEADTLMQITAAPNDELYSKQWHLFEDKGSVRVPNVWDKTKGAGQVVAVIDTGITQHSDLNANILPGYDMISTSTNSRDGDGRDSNPQDQGDYRDSGDCNLTSTAPSSWHGTHVAGTIAAVTDNATGVAGVAPDAKIVPVRVLGQCGGYNSDVADAIIWASGAPVAGTPLNANPARVINLSLGGPPACHYTMQNAINTATSRGSVVIAASGNSNVNASTFSPASCNDVVTVGATNREGLRASYSNFGDVVDISAPGGDGGGAIASTSNAGSTTPSGEAYTYMYGTSMAAPHVAGVAALMLAADPALTPADVESRLKSTSRGLLGICAEGCGAGITDASAAVIFPTPAPAPVVITVNPVSSAVPTITGTTKVGQILTADAGSWGPEGVELSYQWNVAGTAVEGATGSAYTVQTTDEGKAISVTVTGSKTGTESKTETSANTSVITKGSLATTAASITGTAKVGYRLTANHAAWGPAPVAMSYQWYRSGVAISGATASSYVLTGYDHNKTMTVRVIGRKEGYTAVYRQSPATAAVAPGDLKGEFPKISGTTKVGSTLTASPGLWTSGTTVSYQWYRDGVAISGATTKSFVLTEADRGHQIKVRVLGKKTGYTSRAYYSYSTVKIS